MMAQISTGKQTDEHAAQALRNDLARGDEAIAASYPMLRGVLASGPSPWLNEELVARVRGMILDVARQLLVLSGDHGAGAFALTQQSDLAAVLCDNPIILGHAQCLALEAQLTGQMQLRHGLDPVLSLLMHEQISAADEAVAGLARLLLGAQVSFLQSCERMELPLSELPGDALHATLSIIRDFGVSDERIADNVERQMAATYDEREGRLGLMERFVTAIGEHEAALDLHRAGLAIFVTALAIASSQDRELVVMALSGRQSARLGLGLLAAGLDNDTVSRRLYQVDQALVLPESFATLDRADAFNLLHGSKLGGVRGG